MAGQSEGAELDVQLYDDEIATLCEGGSTDDLVTFLGDTLPGPGKFEFELNVTFLVEKCASDLHPQLEGILEGDYPLGKLLPDDMVGDRIRFAAFHALATYYRRTRSLDAWHDLITSYRREFEDVPMFDFHTAMYLYYSHEVDGISRAIRLLRSLADDHPDHPGILNAFTGAVNNGLDEGAISGDDELLDEALRSVERAIELYDYPEYHFNKGRLLGYRGKYTEAKSELRTAINREKARKERYGLRVSRFRYHLLKVQNLEAEDRIKEQVANARDDVEEVEERAETLANRLQRQTLQAIAFFSGIVAVIVASVTLATRLSPIPASGLILVLTGGLIVAFASLQPLLPDSDYRPGRSFIVTIVTGLGLITLGIGVALVWSRFGA